MPSIQNLFKRIFPRKWAADMEAESRQWFMQCPGCGYERSVWDAGGVRWKATSGGRRVLMRCPSCGKLTWAKFIKRETPQPAKTA